MLYPGPGSSVQCRYTTSVRSFVQFVCGGLGLKPPFSFRLIQKRLQSSGRSVRTPGFSSSRKCGCHYVGQNASYPRYVARLTRQPARRGGMAVWILKLLPLAQRSHRAHLESIDGVDKKITLTVFIGEGFWDGDFALGRHSHDHTIIDHGKCLGMSNHLITNHYLIKSSHARHCKGYIHRLI